MKKRITAIVLIVGLVLSSTIGVYADEFSEEIGASEGIEETTEFDSIIPIQDELEYEFQQEEPTESPNEMYFDDGQYDMLLEENAIDSTINGFINDSRWANGVSWPSDKRPIISSYDSQGCAAYCADYVKYCYNKNNPRDGEVFTNVSDIRSGDVLTVGNQSSGYGHWFICLERSGNNLYVAEGNYGRENPRVRIGWNYSISGDRISGTDYSFTAGYHFLSLPENPKEYILSAVYVIHSALDDDYCLDIYADSTENDANIQLYKENNSDVQKFRVIKWGEKDYYYYCIQSFYSGKWLDVKHPIESGANVKLYNTNTAEENDWYFEDAGDGYVYIRNRTGYYLNVEGNTASNNANIEIHDFTGNDSQKWRLEDVTDYKYVMSGEYYVHSAKDDNYCLDIAGDSMENDANIQLYQQTNNSVQDFRFIKKGQSYYWIQSVYSEKWLDVKLPVGDNANVKLYNNNEALENNWIFEDAGDGYVYIRNYYGYYLDLEGDKAVNNANIQLYHFAGNKSQKWRLEEITKYKDIDLGTYSIHSAWDDNYCLDIYADSMENDANIQLYEENNKDIQNFKFIKRGDYYCVQSVYSGKWLDIKTPVTNNSNVKLYNTNSGKENDWLLEDAGDGYVYIKSRLGFYLDVQGDKAVNNANIQVYHFVGNKSQKWRLDPKDIPLTALAFSETKVTLYNDIPELNEHQLTPIYTPANTTEYTKLQWSSSNPSVATVDANGNVHAVGRGVAEITASINDITAVCEVEVIQPASYILVPNLPDDIEVHVGESVMAATVFPENANNRNMSWEFDTEGIATGDENGAITGVKSGSTYATVTAEDEYCIGTRSERVKVNVYGLIKVEKANADCENDGHIEYWKCNHCNKIYADERGENELTEEDIIIPAKGHSWGSPVYNWSNDGKTVTASRVCRRDINHTESETVEVNSTVIRNATCENAGQTKYSAAFNNPAFETQSKVLEDIPATGHAWGEWQEAEPSTCISQGQEVRICANDENHKEYRNKDLSSHTLVRTERKESDCVNEGNIEFWTCSVCGAMFSDEDGITEISVEDTKIPLTDHTWSEGTVTVEPTIYNSGTKEYTCTVCHAVRNEEIPMLPPDRTTLSIIIKGAKSTFAGIKVSEDGSDIESSEYWVTPETAEEFRQAIEAAESVLGNENADQVILDEACDSLSAAIQKFTKSYQNGTSEPTIDEKIELDQKDVILDPKTSLKLNAVISPDTAPDKNIEWTSSDKNIVTVDQSGNITGIKQGRAVITARIEGKDIGAKCNVRVLFADVNRDHGFYNAVYWANDNGIAAGYSGAKEGLFGVSDNITRGQVMMFLWRAANKPEPKSNAQTFNDVPTDHNFYKAIQWGVEQGITGGYTGKRAGTFGPTDNCTRGQIAMFLWRFAGKQTPSGNGKTFTDVPKSNNFYTAIMWASENGITAGYSDGSFGVNKACTRGHCVTFLYRLMK